MKHLAGFAGCVVAIVLGVALTRLFTAPAEPPLPPPPSVAPEPPPEPPEPPAPAPFVAVDQLTLDRAKRQIAATLNRIPLQGGSAPSRFWITFHLFVRAGASFSSEPVEVTFDAGGSRVTVTAPAKWVGTKGDPGSGYFALISVSTEKDRAAPAPRVETRPQNAIPVLVLGER